MDGYTIKHYKGRKITYDTRIPAKQLDTKVDPYQPQRSIEKQPIRAQPYGSRLPDRYRHRTYDTDVYRWSGGPQAGTKKESNPGPDREKEDKEEKEKEEKNENKKEKKEKQKETEVKNSVDKKPKTSKVNFVLLPETEQSPQVAALGSVRRMLDLFGI